MGEGGGLGPGRSTVLKVDQRCSKFSALALVSSLIYITEEAQGPGEKKEIFPSMHTPLLFWPV